MTGRCHDRHVSATTLGQLGVSQTSRLYLPRILRSCAVMAPHNARLGVEFLPTTDFSETKTPPREGAGMVATRWQSSAYVRVKRTAVGKRSTSSSGTPPRSD